MDAATYAMRVDGRPAPRAQVAGDPAFMVETRLPLVPTTQAMASPALQDDYDAVWSGLRRHFRG